VEDRRQVGGEDVRRGEAALPHSRVDSERCQSGRVAGGAEVLGGRCPRSGGGSRHVGDDGECREVDESGVAPLPISQLISASIL
jgi:hypothetical protein